MKKILIAVSAAALLAGQVAAGSFEEPAVEAVEVVEESNSAGWLVPLIAIGVVLLLVSQDDDDCPSEPNGRLPIEEFERCFGDLDP